MTPWYRHLAITVFLAVTPALGIVEQCDRERASLGTQQSTQLTFRNGRTSAVKVYWVDFNGTRKPYMTLQGGQSYDQQTYVDHVWVVTDESDNCLLVATAEAEAGEVVIPAE